MPEKELNLSGAKALLSSEEPKLNLSGALGILKKKGQPVASSTPTSKQSELGGMTDQGGVVKPKKPSFDVSAGIQKFKDIRKEASQSYYEDPTIVAKREKEKSLKQAKVPQEDKKIKNIESDGSFLGDLGAMFLKSANSKETDENLKAFRKLPTEEVVQAVDYVGDKLPDRVKNAWSKGKIQGQIANTLYTGAEPDENSLIKIAELNQQSDLIPESAESKRLNADDGISWALSNPLQGSKALGEIILNSLGAQFEASKRTTGGAVAIGAAAGSVIPGIGTAAGAMSGFTAGQMAAGFNLSTSGKILEVLSDLKIDIKNPNSLIEAFKNPEIMDRARDLAIKRAIPIAILDLLTAGIAGKVGAATAVTKLGKIGKGLGVAGIEATGGSLSELGAQLAAGEKINKNSILLEGVAQLGSGAPALISETASTVLSRNKTSTSDVNIRKQVSTDSKTAISEVKQNLDKQLQVGLISQEDYDSGIKTLENTVAKNEKVPEVIDGDTREKIIELIEDRDARQDSIAKLEARKENVDVAFHSIIDDTIKDEIANIEQLNTQIADLSKQQIETKKQEATIPDSLKDVENTYNALSGFLMPSETDDGFLENSKELNDLFKLVNFKFFKRGENAFIKNKKGEFGRFDDLQIISEEYHKAKASGKNTKLVKAVEELLTPKQPEDAVQIETAGQVPVQPEARVSEEVEQGKTQPEVEGVTEEGGKEEVVAEAPQQTVEQLRAQEQAEYAAMANPEDKVERKKIYDKYDKLITPLIREAKQEVSTKELIDAQNKLKRAKSEASKNRLIQEVEKLSTPEQFKQFIQDNPELAKNLPKQEETVSAPPIAEELEVEGEVETPSEAKRREIEKRQKELLNNIRKKLGNISSGFNPDVIADLIKLGATYIELGAVNFKDFAEQIKAAYGSDIPEDNLRDIFKQSAKSLGKGIKKLPTRIAADEGLSPKLRTIAEKIDAVYQKQNYEDIQASLDEMSKDEKISIVAKLENVTDELNKEGNVGVLAAIDLLNKYEAEGDLDGAERVFNIISKSSTVFAQLLRQYGQLKSSTVQGFLSLIEKDMLKKYGVQITDAQKADITKLYEDIKSKTEAAKQALENHIKDLTNKTQKDLGKADIELENSVRLFNDYLDKLKPKTWKGLVDKMIAITQGNLLTLKSLVVNPLANIIQYGNKFASNEVANLLDLVISTVKSTPRTRISGFNSDALRLSGKSAFSGLKAANRSLLRGATATEISKYDVSGRLKPVEAWKSLWQTLSGKKQITAPGVLTDLLEGIPGAPANLALRLLPYGDLPRNQMAKTYKLVEIGITKFNLKGKDLDRFILNPDKESLAIAEDYGDRATLQNKTLFYDLINKGIAQFDAPSDSKATAGLKSLGKFITRGLIVPFLKTPINAAVMAFRLSNPIVPLGQAGIEFGKIIEYRKGKNVDIKNKKISESQHKITGYLGEAIVAQVVLMSAVMLVKYGLTSGGVPDKDKKERDFMFQTFGPNQINISGLKRLIAGGDPTFKQGDVAISYMPLGLLGAQLGVVTEGYKQREKEAEKQSKVKTAEGKPFYSTAWDANKELGNAVTENLPASAKYMLDQGFVQGTSAILDAVSKNDYDRWSSQWVKTFTTGLAMPNTIVQTLRASNEFMTNTFDDDQVKNIANTVKNLYGDTEDLPIRYDMWGNKILQTPKGENPYVYHIIDIFRSQQLLQDKDTYNVFLLYKKTGDRSVIPSSVSDIVEESRSEFKIKLTPQQTADLQRIVGEERLKRIKKRTPFNINNNKPDYLEQEVAGYKRAYENGLAAGKRRFKTEVLDKVKK